MPTQKGNGFMARNLTQQLNYAICSSLHIGESKYQYKSDHNGTVDGRIYAVQSAENLRATANSFGKFMKAHHPEIRMVRDITNVHLQEYINASSKKWTQKTTDSKVSDLRRIMDRAERRFGRLGCRPSEIVSPTVAIYCKRDTAMSRADLEKIKDSFRGRSSRSEGLTALEISSRTGLRIKEIARLETKNVDLEKGIIRVREGGKNGKYRDVPIRERDKAYFAEIKALRVGERFLCRGVGEDGLNRAIRREMKACGLDGKYNTTTNHAIRKLYATERMKEEVERGRSEKEAWQIVQVELGHGAVFREKLFNTYVKQG